MNEVSEIPGSEYIEEDERRYGDMDPMEAMSELDIAYTNLGPEKLREYPGLDRISRSIASMEERDLARWVSLVVPSKDPKAMEFYLQRATLLYDSCLEDNGKPRSGFYIN